jgi:hypothetical protein
MAKRAARPLALLAMLGGACTLGRPPAPAPLPPLRHVGGERTVLGYDDPRAPMKRLLLERINRDRARSGAPPLAYESRAALVGDQFCLEAALAGTTGHWDPAGRAPYLRWALAGGVDYHAENAVAFSFSSGAVTRPLEELALEGHLGMMAEVPPRDGHRRTILDPGFTHVGIGLGVAAGEFRMTQEFTRVALAWLELPEGPQPAGSLAYVAGRPLPGLHLELVEIRYEPVPRPLRLLEREPRRSGYAYPPVIETLRPGAGATAAYSRGGYGDVRRDASGRFSLGFRLSQGPGHYFVLCHVAERLVEDAPLGPATAALVIAVP